MRVRSSKKSTDNFQITKLIDKKVDINNRAIKNITEHWVKLSTVMFI